MEVELKSNDEDKPPTISSLPDFAQIFTFLQLFGVALHLPPVTLKELEDFFSYGKCCVYDSLVVSLLSSER